MVELQRRVIACAVVVATSQWFVSGDGRHDQQHSSCSAGGCEVDLVERARLLDPSPSILSESSVIVSRDTDGRYWAVGKTGGRIIVFDSQGRVRATLGEKLEGGLHLVAIGRLLPAANGGTFVYDYRQGVATLLGRDLKPQRTLSLRYLPSVSRPDGSVVIARQIQTPEHVGYPLHVMNAQGRIVRSFGTDTPQFRADIQPKTERLVASAANGRVWVMSPADYTFELWDPEKGTRLSTITVKSPRAGPLKPATDERIRPLPLVEAFWEKDGIFWTCVREADTAWQPPQGANTERSFNISEYNKTYDWVLEAIDVGSGRVVAERRLSVSHWAQMSAPLLVKTERNKEGRLEYGVFESTLKNKEKQ